MESGNLALKRMKAVGRMSGEEAMTVEGTAAKTIFLFLPLLATAFFVWSKYMKVYAGSVDNIHRASEAILPYFFIGLIGGFIIGIITIVARKASPILSIIYAALEGMCLGGLSAMLERAYPGIVIQAVLLTFGIFAVTLIAYVTHIIRASEKLVMFVVIATGGICLTYLVTLGLNCFGMTIPLIHKEARWASSSVLWSSLWRR